jgi:hypothetical protein
MAGFYILKSNYFCIIYRFSKATTFSKPGKSAGELGTFKITT